MPLPLRAMPLCEAPQMNRKRLTGPTPLLQTTLAFGTRGSSAATTTCGVMVMPQHMLTVPMGICALGPRHPPRALGAMAAVKPLGHRASKFGEESIKFVDTKKMLLPLQNAHGAIMIKSNCTRIV